MTGIDLNPHKTSEALVSSGTLSGHVSSPIRRLKFTAHTRKSIEELTRVHPNPAFFHDHLKACPASLADAIKKCSDVQQWIADITQVETKEASPCEPVAKLLSKISETVFSECSVPETLLSSDTPHIDLLQGTEDKDRLHLPEQPIVFLNHCNHAPTHSPVGTVEDNPDIICAVGRDDGYRMIANLRTDRTVKGCRTTASRRSSGQRPSTAMDRPKLRRATHLPSSKRTPTAPDSTVSASRPGSSRSSTRLLPASRRLSLRTGATAAPYAPTSTLCTILPLTTSSTIT